MKFQSKVFNEFDKIDWEAVGPGMKRKIMGYDDNIMLVYVHFEKGGIGARHKHPHSQTSFAESGKFEITVGNEPKVLKRMIRFTLRKGPGDPRLPSDDKNKYPRKKNCY